VQTLDSKPADYPSLVRGGVVVLAPKTGPTLAAPLGWVLSEGTQAELDGQLEARWAAGTCDDDLGRLKMLLQISECP
jgi:hypothetical protein